MLFNSIEFAVFLPVVFLLYWFVLQRSVKMQNALLLIASYFFYGWWDWRFLSLIAFSSAVDYMVGVGMSRTEKPRQRKVLLLVSIAVNLGFLGFFKYFNFFAESLSEAFTLLGHRPDVTRLNVVLPVGISFYTFQTLSYSIDVYKRRMKPTRDPLAFFSFVSFFPQLVAGPIERASNLLPQFSRARNFDASRAADGMRQILWGLFKKVVIADNCAMVVNDIFAGYGEASGSTLLLGGVLFAFQIYGDFSGYSDIAIGTARLFGFSLMRNFAFPYFSRDIAEFWRRWHISLSTWFRDYLYVPLGGSRGSTLMKVRNTFIIFIVSGFWHGANWTFVAWGFLNACYFLPLLLTKTNRRNLDVVASGRLLPRGRELLQMGMTFFVTVLAWIFFRSATVTDALAYIRRMFSASLFTWPDLPSVSLIALLVVFIVAEWLQRDKQHALQREGLPASQFIRWSIYYFVVMVIVWFGGTQQSFIYFQF